MSTVFRPKAENWCISKCDVEKVHFEWNIQQFLIVTSEGQDDLSVQFQEKKRPSVIWCLTLHNRRGHVTLGVSQPSRHYTDQSYRVEMTILNEKAKGGKAWSQTVIVPKKFDGIYEFMKIEKLLMEYQYMLSDGSVTVGCEIEYITKEESVSDKGITHCTQPASINCTNQLVTQQERLFEDMQFSDIILNVHGRQFEAHKCILASSSKVFEAMFKHPTKEKITNHVVIEDIQPEVFHQLLRFIYTGRLTSTTMETMAARLFAAADKYLLDQLKSECESHLLRQMSAENCMELLLLSSDQIHPADNLKTKAVDFFRRYPREVMATEGWKKARQEHPNHSIWNLL